MEYQKALKTGIIVVALLVAVSLGTQQQQLIFGLLTDLNGKEFE